MSFPQPTEQVIFYKRQAGKVTVHAWRKHSPRRFITDCGRESPAHLRTWDWLEYRTLNSAYVTLCQRCWGSPEPRTSGPDWSSLA